jgi:hypothetical protein
VFQAECLCVPVGLRCAPLVSVCSRRSVGVFQAESMCSRLCRCVPVGVPMCSSGECICQAESLCTRLSVGVGVFRRRVDVFEVRC